MYVISNIIAIIAQNNVHLFKMATKKQTVFPKYNEVYDQMGKNMKLAGKRQKLTMIQVAETANISRSTLHLIESGKPSVAMGVYLNVVHALGLQDDFLKLAADDELGRKLQYLELLK